MSHSVPHPVLSYHSPYLRAVLCTLCLTLTVAPPLAFSRSIQLTKTFGKGLLWRVSKGGHSSYVFGTLHLADPRALDVPEAVGRAVLSSRSYVAESLPGEREAVRLFEAAQFKDGRGLEALIGAEAYARAAEVLRAREVPEDVIARIKPWAALIAVIAAPRDYDDERPTLDRKLLELARENGLRVIALENAQELVSVFDRIPLETQIKLLRHALAHREELTALLEATVEAWLKRDLIGVHAFGERVARRFPEMAGDYRMLFTISVEDRSAVMARRLLVPLQGGGAFVAVGAAHLYGAGGLLALIERRGYRIERVY